MSIIENKKSSIKTPVLTWFLVYEEKKSIEQVVYVYLFVCVWITTFYREREDGIASKILLHIPSLICIYVYVFIQIYDVILATWSEYMQSFELNLIISNGHEVSCANIGLINSSEVYRVTSTNVFFILKNRLVLISDTMRQRLGPDVDRTVPPHSFDSWIDNII